ncbi:MAG: DUF131 domain-containing protein [Candidatus Bathyarchaeia archaeon]
MTSEEGESRELAEIGWIRLFIMLFFVGFFIILTGIMIMVAAALLFGEGTGSVGGFILIGPFPIVFGTGPEATWLALFAIILGILSVTFFFILLRRRVKKNCL